MILLAAAPRPATGAAAVLGSFGDPDNAMREHDRIAELLGVPLALVPARIDGMSLYRIVSTDTPDEAAARALVAQAREAGIAGAWYMAQAPETAQAPEMAPDAVTPQSRPEDTEGPAPEAVKAPSLPEVTKEALESQRPQSAPARAPRPAVDASAMRHEEERPAQPRVEPWLAYHEFSGDISLEGRWYPDKGGHPGQRSHASGFVLRPELYLEDRSGRSLTVRPFFRYDAADAKRTHADLHEAYALLVGQWGANEWELRLGIDRVFWGVTESQHLVDIVNQVDLVEHPNEKARLGQLMAHLTWAGGWGAFELFGITGHRGRTFSGRYGRLRLPLLIDRGATTYESGAKEWHVDFAARYSGIVGALDIGVSVFDGTSREPFLLPAVDGAGTPIFAPHYRKIRQFGLDAQLTTGRWQYKLEAIRRVGAYNALGREEAFSAFVAGGEYTLYSLFGSGADLGLLGEWNYDARRKRATSRFQNDLFFGSRLAFNDEQGTEFIGGVLTDLDHDSRFVSLELSRRLRNNWSLHFETVLLLNVGEADLLYAMRRDSFIELDLVYSF